MFLLFLLHLLISCLFYCVLLLDFSLRQHQQISVSRVPTKQGIALPVTLNIIGKSKCFCDFLSLKLHSPHLLIRQIFFVLICSGALLQRGKGLLSVISLQNFIVLFVLLNGYVYSCFCMLIEPYMLSS